MPTLYKVVETSDVTDVELERLLNEWTAQGWSFDGIQFAMRESSKRPAMAFLTFTRSERSAVAALVTSLLDDPRV